MYNLFLGVMFAAVAAAAGCAVPVDVNVGVDLDDRCLLMQPECDPDRGGEYLCVDSEGTPQPSCIVACIAGRELTCEPTGPWCRQSIGDQLEHVPVVCVSRGE